MASAIRQEKAANMTEGSIARHLLSFAFPLLLGNLFQQLYNTVDTRVVGFFNPNEEVIAFGILLLRTISPFYLVYCVHDTLGGALRGAGNGKVPMIVTLICMVGFRQAYLYVMANYICNEVIPIAFSFPAGWILSAAIVLIYFLRTNRSSTKLVE